MKPSRLLLTWLAGLLVLMIGLGAWRVLASETPEHLSALGWGLLLGLAALAVMDALLALRMRPPQVRRDLPARLALGQWQDVRLTLSSHTARPLRVQVVDHAPDGLETEPAPVVTLEHDVEQTLVYRLRPRRRGVLHFERCEVLAGSLLGLWQRRLWVPLVDVTRVYPDVARLYRGELPGVERGTHPQGVHAQPRRGLGLEFRQLREFRDGDSLRQIDWKATARQRTPIARDYQDERDQHIVFLIDCGQRMRSKDGHMAHLDHALDACLQLSREALRQGDAVGLATFAAERDRYLAPRNGEPQLHRLLEAVHDLDSSQQVADFNAAVSLLLTRQRRRALVVVITNLRDGDDEALLAAVRRLERHHRVLVASLREEVLDSLRSQPVQHWQQALTYCATVEYLHDRDRLHERVAASGIALIDARPAVLGAALVSRYRRWKKAGSL